MTRLGEAPQRSTWRLSVGTALVSGGVVAVGLGAANVFDRLFLAAGLGADLAWMLGIGAAALLVPLLIAVIGARLGTPTPYRRGLALGIGLATLGAPIVVFVATTTPGGAVTMLATIPYAGGVVLALWSVVAGAATAPRPRRGPVYHSRNGGDDSHASAADGGEEDDLSFPLDDN